MAHIIPSGARKGSRYHRLDDIPTNTFTPQTYQIQLLDSALRRNTLLCLGCSQSKVFLALMVAKELASITRIPMKKGGKRTFYLVDTEESADTLCQTLPHHTDLVVELCLASMLKDGDSSEADGLGQWQQMLDRSNILICHGPVFMAALQKNYVQLKDINLLIFDDCHKSVEVDNHPYVAIVSSVKSEPVKSQPRILGLTTAIAGTECSDPIKLKETIASMESSMHAYAETSMLILSERFGCRPKETIIRCEEAHNEEQAHLKELLEDILEQSLFFFTDCCIPLNEDVDKRNPTEVPIQVLSECLNILNILGPWCTSSVAEYFVMQLDKIIKCEKNDIHKKFLRCVNTTLRQFSKEFEMHFHPNYDVDELLAYATPKVRELVKVLRFYKSEVDFMIISSDTYENGDDLSDMSDDDDSIMSGSDEEGDESSSRISSKPMHIAVKRTPDGGHERIMTYSEEEEKNLCGIVFVENRYIAFGLNKMIEEVCSWDENLCFVRSCHITGQGLRGTGSKVKANKAYKRQEEALRKFRTQECNLVIATQELEEGIDIPKCNLVVRFDSPKDYRSYTLSKGRARGRDASYVILLKKEHFDPFYSRVEVFKEIEQVLLGEKRNTVTKSDTFDEICTEDEETADETENDLLPPYRTSQESQNSPQVTMEGAIALINRYCAKLPSDAFTHLTPQCRVERLCEEPPQFVAHLRLPINSPVKEELKGPAMKSSKLAKMAVALKMCEILHINGELDENLVPVGKEMFLYEEEEEWADEEDMAGQARPGTTKRKQYYVKKVADALVHSCPKAGTSSFLYLLNLRLTGPITEEQNTRGRIIYAPEDTTQTLGMLVAKKIPEMPCFPVYTRSGEVTASVDLLQSHVTFTEEQIDQLLQFHHFVFSGVLHLEKDPMEFDPKKADSGCIVPLSGEDGLDIDWPFVNKVIQFMKIEKTTGFSKLKDEKSFQFSVDAFKDAVVMPSYRNIDQPQHFYVAEIRQDLNPLSPFPSPELYKTFQDYYTTKYGLKITNIEQPLLDVDHTSARLNLLTPRYMNQKGVALPTSSIETKRARRENLQQKQILVPELCDIHVFPASLWRKTVCLPAILYRTNCLMLAEELRRKISKETGIGVENLPPGFRFPQLDFGFETSPEKLKEAEMNDSCKKSLSNEKNKKVDTEQVFETALDPTEAYQSEANELKDLFDMKPDESSPADGPLLVDDETASGLDLKLSQDKTDSSSSSDSDSGIASSGSDSNLDTNIKACDIPSEKNLDLVVNSESPQEWPGKELTTEDVIEEPILTSNLENNLCKSSPHNKCPSSAQWNNPDQCNIIYTSETNMSLSLCSSAIGQHTSHSCSNVSTSDDIIPDCTNLPPHNLVSETELACNGPASTLAVCARGLSPSNDSSSTLTLNAHTAASVETDDHNLQVSSSVIHFETGAKLDAAKMAMPCLIPSQSTPCPSFNVDSLLPQLSRKVPVELEAGPLHDRKSQSNEGSHNTTHGNMSIMSSLSSPHMTKNETTLYCKNEIDNICSSTINAASGDSGSRTHNGHSVPDPPDSQGCENAVGAEGYDFCETPSTADSSPAVLLEHRLPGDQQPSHCDSIDDHQPTIQLHGVTPPAPCHHPCVSNDQISPHEIVDRLETNTVRETEVVCKETNGSNDCCTNTKTVNAPHPPQTKFIDKPASPHLMSKAGKGQNSASAIKPCLVMNTLGQELSDIDIDLIYPRSDISTTFHSNDWGPGTPEQVSSQSMGKHEACDVGSQPDCATKTNFSENINIPAADSGDGMDSDIIKFSFSADMPKEKKTANEELVIGTWRSDEGQRDGDAKEPLAEKKKGEKQIEDNISESSPEPKIANVKDFNIGVWNSRRRSHLRDCNPALLTLSKNCQNLARSQHFSPSLLCKKTSSMDSTQTALPMRLDEDRDLKTFVGPSPCLILQAITMSNANDFFSLERLETIGDSFLKYAITVYLYCSYPGIHEGKLSYLRSKQVSNYNLYRLGRRKSLAECMVSTKFEPYENWLPLGFVINESRRRGPVPKVVIVTSGAKATNASRNFYVDETSESAKREAEAVLFNKELEWIQQSQEADQQEDLDDPNQTSLTPYSLQCHHGLPDKSVADCVEALIGCYLTTCGRKAALMFMSWLGLRVLPKKKRLPCRNEKVQGSLETRDDEEGKVRESWKVSEHEFDELRCPPSPMFNPTLENQAQLNHLLEGFEELEENICYKFQDRSYLLQAFTHASYHYNTITDCYQRVEFLGDAILDYVITRHLYEDSQKYSPGILTDLRSALVNNNIFAALAVKWGFHKYFKAVSPSLFHVIDQFVKKQKEKNQDDIDIDEEFRELEDGEMDEGNEVEEGNEEDDDEEEVEMEIPKALGDIFESVAGAIYLDSEMSLDTVWQVYYRMMKPHIDKYLKSIPKSPVRELLETEPETAKFERPERTINGKVRVTVNVVGKGVFSGVGRNYRIAKSAAAKKALRSIRTMAQNLAG